MKAAIVSRLLPSLFAVALLAACAAGAPQGTEPNAAGPPSARHKEAAPLPVDFPAFPLEREGQGITDYVALGADCETRSNSAVVSGSDLLLIPPDGSLSWAIWRFSPHAGHLERLDFLLTMEKGNQVWLMLADFSTGRWSPRGPFSKSEGVALSRERHVSPEGDVFAALLVPSGNLARVRALSLRAYSTDGQPPLAQLMSDVDSGNAPLMVSFDASGSSDPGGKISHYLWDFEGDGTYEGLSYEPTITHQYSHWGEFNANVLVVDNEGDFALGSIAIDVNSLPDASLATSETSLFQGDKLELWCTGAVDPDGEILDTIWDLDGDGYFDSTSFERESGGKLSASLIANSTGTQYAYVRLIDNDGAEKQVGVSFFVHGFQNHQISGLSNRFTPLDMERQKTGVAMVFDSLSFGMEGLVFAYADLDDAWPPAIEYSIIREEPFYESTKCDLEILSSGQPALLYISNDPALRYAAGENMDGLGNWNDLIIEEGLVGLWGISLAVVDGSPAVSYRSSNELFYRISSSFDGRLLNDWNPPVLLANAMSVSLSTLDGRPCIAGRSGDDLTLQHSSDSRGESAESWSFKPAISDANPNAIELLEVQGEGAMIYAASSQRELVYARNRSNQPDVWDRELLSNYYEVHDVQIEVIDQRPCVAFVSEEGLHVCWSQTESGLGDWTTYPLIVANGGLTGRIALSSHEDMPVLMYKRSLLIYLARLV